MKRSDPTPNFRGQRFQRRSCTLYSTQFSLNIFLKLNVKNCHNADDLFWPFCSTHADMTCAHIILRWQVPSSHFNKQPVAWGAVTLKCYVASSMVSLSKAELLWRFVVATFRTSNVNHTQASSVLLLGRSMDGDRAQSRAQETDSWSSHHRNGFGVGKLLFHQQILPLSTKRGPNNFLFNTLHVGVWWVKRTMI